MRRFILLLTVVFVSLALCSCSTIDQIFSFRNPLEGELVSAERIVFTNNKDSALRFTVADPNVIKQIAGIVCRGKIIDQGPAVDSDYSIRFYMPNGRQYDFSYWMGASQNGRKVNLKDAEGVYYGISESMDTYIVNSTKMFLRPNDFVSLYEACVTEAISQLGAESSGENTVGVDIKSDRRMLRYTMSYEQERLLQNIKSDNFKIAPYTEGGKYDFVVSFLTNIYNPDKAEIQVDIVKTSDQTVKSIIFKPAYKDGKWQINKVDSEKAS